MDDPASHADTRTEPPRRQLRLAWPAGLAVVALAALIAATALPVPAGTAMVVTEFGRPVRVLTSPGLAWTLPVEGAFPVDLRLRATSGDIQTVTMRDGTPLQVQAFVVWQVAPAPAEVERFLDTAGGDVAEAARQVQALADAAVQQAAGGFAAGDLANATPGRQRVAAFEAKLRAPLEAMLRTTYGIALRQVGVERLGLPGAALARQRAEQQLAAARTIDAARRESARIRAQADSDRRVAAAAAAVQAAGIKADAERQAAAIEAHAFNEDPQLYTLLRSLDSLATVIGPNTRLVLRTDAAPFSALVAGPPQEAPK